MYIVVILMIQLFGSGHTQTSSSLFQCHSSSNQNGLIYTPNILDFYFNDVNAANFRIGGRANLTTSRNGFTYIFTIPSESSLRNCSGTVVSLQYCYEARNSELRKTNDVFNFLSITRNNLLFTANSRLTIQTTPQNSICTDPPGGIQQICCDTSSLSANNQFQLPSSDFTFGVVITNSNVRPLVFTTSALEYRVEQFQAALGADGPTPGNRVTLGDNTRVNGGSLVFRFLIEPPPTQPPTATPTTTPTTPTEPFTTQSTIPTESPTTPPTTPTELTTPSTISTESPSTPRPPTTPTEPVITIPTESPTTPQPPTISTELPTTQPTIPTEPLTTPSTIPTESPTTLSTIPTESPTTPGPPTESPKTPPTIPTEPSTTSIPPTTQRTTTTDSEQVTTKMPTTEIVTTDERQATSGQLPTQRGNDTANAASPGMSISGAAVGGAVGGCAVVLILIAAVVCGVVVMMKYQSRRKLTLREKDGMAFQNAIYEEVDSEGISWKDITQPTYVGDDYSEIGPQVSENSSKSKGMQERHEYYADSGATYDLPSFKKDPTEMLSTKEENIYMVPATDEKQLYSQLKHISIQYLPRDSIKLGDRLGSGQFGVVYKGVLQSPELGEVDVAVKTLKEGSGEEDRVKFLQEAAIMGQFKHHNVVTMYGVVTDGEPILLALELLIKGDLKDHLFNMRSEEKGVVGVDNHTLLSYCRQVASGMVYLSNKAFIHRDLAARNILVSEDEICKIADFGMSRDLMDENYYVSHGGKVPIKWTAPEALHYLKYSSASDVWSYGVLMYEIWSVGHKPYKDYANNKVLQLIDTGFRPSPPPGCPRALYNIMISCWNPVASGRPNFSDISRQLSFPDTKLLQWSEEDRVVHPEATKLGADLLCGQELYKDLQTRYKQEKPSE